MQYARRTSSLHGGARRQVANVFFADVMDQDDEFLDKAIEAWCSTPSTRRGVHCPSRALIQESIYDKFMARCLDRIRKITQATRSTRRP